VSSWSEIGRLRLVAQRIAGSAAPPPHCLPMDLPLNACLDPPNSIVPPGTRMSFWLPTLRPLRA